MDSKKILALGGIYLDINTPDFPFGEAGLATETETVGGAYILEAGGSAPNFARLCSSLGLTSIFVGKVGDDDMGRMFKKSLEEAGVTPALIADPNAQTNISMNVVNNDGKSIMLVAGTGNALLRPDEIEQVVAQQLGDSAYLYLSGCFKLLSLLPAFVAIVDRAKEKGVKVVLDHGRLHSGVTEDQRQTVKQLALQVDYYVPSNAEFSQLWEAATLEEGLRNFTAQSKAVVVVKDGAEGAVTFADGSLVRVPAFEAEPIHTVGAGDSFNAGLIIGLSSGMDLYGSMRFACATAAVKISQKSLPTKEQVQQKLVH